MRRKETTLVSRPSSTTHGFVYSPPYSSSCHAGPCTVSISEGQRGREERDNMADRLEL